MCLGNGITSPKIEFILHLRVTTESVSVEKGKVEKGGEM